MPQIGNYYAIPGTFAPDIYDEAGINLLISTIEEHFGLDPGTIKKKYETGRPVRKIDGVCLSDIRKAIILLVHKRTPLSKGELARVINVDHSSYSAILDKAKLFYDIRDESFMNYYNTVVRLAAGERIKDAVAS